MPEQDEARKGSDVQQKAEGYDSVPTYQRDLEARLERDHKRAKPDPSDPVVDPSQVYAPYATETTDTSHYVGVSTEYMTHASDTEAPLPFGGVEQRSVEQTLGTAGFAMSPEPEYQGKQVVGGGSSVESIYTATSGEELETKKVERQAGQKELGRPEQQQAKDSEKSVAAAPAPAQPVKAVRPAPPKPAAQQ